MIILIKYYVYNIFYQFYVFVNYLFWIHLNELYRVFNIMASTDDTSFIWWQLSIISNHMNVPCKISDMHSNMCNLHLRVQAQFQFNLVSTKVQKLILLLPIWVLKWSIRPYAYTSKYAHALLWVKTLYSGCRVNPCTILYPFFH